MGLVSGRDVGPWPQVASLRMKPTRKERNRMHPVGAILSAWSQLCLKLAQLLDFSVHGRMPPLLPVCVGISSLGTKSPDS